jgi:hypothetical protein
MKWFSKVGAWIVLGGLIVSSAQAKLPFTEDFSGPLDPAKWKISGGNWEVKDGELIATNSARASGDKDPLTGFPFGTFDYVVALGVGTNMTFQVDATPVALSVELDDQGVKTKGSFARIGLMVHSNGAAQFADKKWMLLWGWMDTVNSFGLALLEEAVAWRQTEPDVKMELGKTYTFKLEVQGRHVKGKVWEKGTTEPDWQVEQDFSGQLTADGIGLLGVGVDVKYDNVKAEALAGAKATITGVVKDAGTGKALAGASVTNGDATATTDANGAFKITVDPGSVGLSAQKAGYITATTADPVDVEAGNTVADVEIQIKPEQLPLTDDFNGGQHKDWLFPTTNDFNGDWSFEGDGYVAKNSGMVADAAPGTLPAQGLYDYTYLPDVGSDVIFTAKVTPQAFGNAGFSRIGLAAHLQGGDGVGGSAEKKWMLLYGVLDVEPDKPFGLALLEEGVKWGARNKDFKLETGKTYVFKMATKGTDVKGKVWEDGKPEPADWTLQDTFSLNQIYAAGVGLLGVGADVRYDDVNVVSNTGTVAPVLPGDLNADGKVNVQDATISLRIAVGSLTATDAQKAAGDVNRDGKWNVQDTTLILRFAVGAITAFPGG